MNRFKNLLIFLFITFTTLGQNKQNYNIIEHLGYDCAIVKNDKGTTFNLTFKTKFRAESDHFDMIWEGIVDKTTNQNLGKYNDKRILLEEDGKYRIRYDFHKNKINIRKDKAIVMTGDLKFEHNRLSEIHFEDMSNSDNSEIIQTWATLVTVNKLYGYDSDKELKESIMFGFLFGLLL